MKSMESPEIANEQEGQRALEQLRNHAQGLIERIRDIAQSLEHIKQLGGRTLRWLSVVAALTAANVEAKELPSKGKLFEGRLEIGTLTNMSLDSIYQELEQYRLALPEDQPLLASYRTEQKGYKSGPISSEVQGTVPVDTGMVGNLTVATTVRVIHRAEQQGTEGQSYDGIDVFSTRVSKVTEDQVEGETKKLHASAIGATREAAVLNAIGRLNEQAGMRARNAEESNRTSEQSGGTSSSGSSLTTVLALDAMNTLENVRIVEVRQVGPSGVEGYEATVQAEVRE